MSDDSLLDAYHRQFWDAFQMNPADLAARLMKFVQQLLAKSDRDKHTTIAIHVYEIRPRTDKSGVDLISDALPYSPLGIVGQTQSLTQSIT